ncbi:organic cation transporter 1 [Caerostris extrusa]|uniref:Organic cation transporter 1 n=1 Tax=Caerostris extrusa TaxID=172846 RepID=A0AAV4N4C3_CAEEX|nr:organic cation transporter 1 [Caerostris extrusa]
MHVIFLTGIPDHWCYVPEIAHSNLSLETQKTLISPPSDPHCSMYDVNYTNILLLHDSYFDSSTPTKPCDRGWYYEKSEFDETAVTAWDLVCKDDHYVAVILSTTFIGTFIGAQFFSSVANKIGRKQTFALTAFIIALSDVGSSLSSNFTLVVLLRILQGTAVSTIYSTPYSLLLELVRPDLRTWMNEISTISWTAGLCLIPMFAWLTRSWVILSAVNSVCAAALFVCGRYIPESPLWLISQGRYEKATDILKKISEFNGKTAHEEDAQLLEKIQQFGREYQRNMAEQKEVSIRDFLRMQDLGKDVSSLRYAGKLLNSVPYFGLQMNTRYLKDDKFINFFLASIVEVPAHFATWYSIAHYGRRVCLLTAFITAAVSGLLPYAFASYKIVHVIATFIGKGCTSSAYITLYVQGPELFPLFLRAAGIGLCCTVGSIGGIIAPYAVYTYKYADYAPFLIFSGIMTLATVCASCLPETSHKKLPITVADAENFQRNWKFFNCPGCPVMDAEPLRSEVLLSFEEAEVRREQDLDPERNWSTLFPSKSDTVLFRKK